MLERKHFFTREVFPKFITYSGPPRRKISRSSTRRYQSLPVRCPICIIVDGERPHLLCCFSVLFLFHTSESFAYVSSVVSSWWHNATTPHELTCRNKRHNVFWIFYYFFFLHISMKRTFSQNLKLRIPIIQLKLYLDKFLVKTAPSKEDLIKRSDNFD